MSSSTIFILTIFFFLLGLFIGFIEKYILKKKKHKRYEFKTLGKSKISGHPLENEILRPKAYIIDDGIEEHSVEQFKTHSDYVIEDNKVNNQQYCKSYDEKKFDNFDKINSPDIYKNVIENFSEESNTENILQNTINDNISNETNLSFSEQNNLVEELNETPENIPEEDLNEPPPTSLLSDNDLKFSSDDLNENDWDFFYEE